VAFVPNDYFDLAVRLAAATAQESDLRAAMSRLYYAAHLLARETLKEKWNCTFSEFGEAHSQVIRELRQRRTKNLSDLLFRLKELREHSDYHLRGLKGISHPNCTLCDDAKKSNTDLVTRSQWVEALQNARRFMPLIIKI
jgi:hypothetical protein